MMKKKAAAGARRVDKAQQEDPAVPESDHDSTESVTFADLALSAPVLQALATVG